MSNVHAFFTTLGWCVKAVNKLSTSLMLHWDEGTVEIKMKAILCHFRHHIKGENGTYLTFALANGGTLALGGINAKLFVFTLKKRWRNPIPYLVASFQST